MRDRLELQDQLRAVVWQMQEAVYFTEYAKRVLAGRQLFDEDK